MQSSSCSPLAVTEQVGNFDGLALVDDFFGLFANVPANPLPELAIAVSSGLEVAFVVAVEPNPEDVFDDFRDPKPVDTAPNPPPNAVDFEEAESPFLESFLLVEDDDFSAPNPWETVPKPAPNPPDLAAALPNPELLFAPMTVDPKVFLALDPKIEVVLLGARGPESFSGFPVAGGANLTVANVPPPEAPPVPPLDHLLLTFTIFRVFMTSLDALTKGSLRLPPSSFRSSSSSELHTLPSG
mmetsp:Transcript_15866/g.34560  ORF Transcript_15866/g.34560 Transcript_15866/m.34560 type:complete len:241 (+) Transcript_15866:472-1194(+)